jgi:polyhydroxybutyrate depolymerase
MSRAIQALIFVVAMLALLILAGGYLLRTSAVAPPELTGAVQSHRFEIQGVNRSFDYYVPGQKVAGSPVVIAFHGSMGDGKRMRQATAYAFDKLADQYGFIVVYPDGFDRHWNDCRVAGMYEARQQNIDDVAFVKFILSFLAQQYEVDLQRVFAMGLSNGGHMAYRLALESPETVKAIAVIAANLPVEDNLDCQATDQPVAVMIINGTDDPINPYQGGEVTLLGPFGSRGRVQSAADSAAYFSQLAGYESSAFQHRFPDLFEGDDSVADRAVWSEDGYPEVSLITVYGGGHTIPHPDHRMPRIFGPTNRDFSAVDEIWRFFQRQDGTRPGT